MSKSFFYYFFYFLFWGGVGVLIIFHPSTEHQSDMFLCFVSPADPRGRLLSGSAVRDGAGGGQRAHPPRHGLLLGPPLPLRHVRDPGQCLAPR